MTTQLDFGPAANLIADDFYIAATGTAFPRGLRTRKAIEQGLYTEEFLARSDQEAVTIAGAGDSAPGFAAAASRQALERAGCQPNDVAALFYSLSGHPGIHLWNSAAYIANEIGMTQGFFIPSEMRSACAGGLTSLALAAAFLSHSSTKRPVALATTGDCWPDHVYDRFRADPGVCYGDGGTAMVLTHTPTWARIVSLFCIADPSLEGLNRGLEPFDSFRHYPGSPIDVKSRAHHFLSHQMTPDEMWARRTAGLQTVVQHTLEAADTSLDKVRFVVPQFLGSERLEREYLEPLNLDVARTTWQFGRRIGHLGTGDPYAGLNFLAETGQLESGDIAVLLGVGAGFVYAAAAVEILDRPPYELYQVG